VSSLTIEPPNSEPSLRPSKSLRQIFVESRGVVVPFSGGGVAIIEGSEERRGERRKSEIYKNTRHKTHNGQHTTATHIDNTQRT